MGGWTLLLGVALAAAVIALLVDYNRRQHEEVYAERMRRSMLYYEIYALVAVAKEHEIDRVQIERNRIVFYAVYPPGKIGEYVLTDHGHRPLNAQRTLALVQALMQDLPVLQENRCYALRRYAVVRPNGQKDYGYQFTIRSHYKTKIMYARQQPWIG
ncbi:MAG: hypothetical protein IJ189_02495 [Clostridia bacterium]|nr:hypothetical protein [Clostridia bacterium]